MTQRQEEARSPTDMPPEDTIRNLVRAAEEDSSWSGSMSPSDDEEEEEEVEERPLSLRERSERDTHSWAAVHQGLFTLHSPADAR